MSQQEDIESHKPNVESVSQFAKRALNEIKNRDDKAIKSAYQSLFNCILVLCQ